MSMLEELYYGNICPAEKFTKRDGEYQKLMVRLTDCIDKLVPLLNEEARTLWNEIRDIDSDIESIADKESFIDGFCIGTRLMLEIMTEDRTNREIL